MTDSPVLSFPSVLRNPGLVSRIAQIQATANGHNVVAYSPKISLGSSRRDQHEGKRWTRRKDNAEFVGNPHIVAATRRDYVVQPPHIPCTFPEPLPPYLPRTAKVPGARMPNSDPPSANAGRFSLSLKGMRKTLRRSGNRAQALVRNIEHELVEWLWEGGTLLNPESAHISDVDVQDLVSRATCVGDLTTVLEVMRTPLQLVWYLEDDAFARYVVHCCARYHEVVSYSKEVAGFRLTYLLRPNVTRPDRRALSTLDTPPVTDIDYSSHPDSEADILSDVSEKGVDSDVEAAEESLATVDLSVITEDDSRLVVDRDSGSVQDYADDVSNAADADDSADEHAPGFIAARLASLGLNSLRDSAVEDLGPGSALQTASQHTSIHCSQFVARRRMWARSASSPSRSPVRTMVYRRLTGRRHYEAPRSTLATLGATRSQMFYDYLYS